jgi:dTMP kinase
MPGRFITFEGGEGSGKSTQIERLAERLRARGFDPLTTREPGGTPLAEKLRELILTEPMDALTETLLLFAARDDHVRTVIAPALAAGTWVLCDRFTDATFAYQGGGKGVPAELIAHLAQVSHNGLMPDLTLVFDCPYEVSRERLGRTGRAPDRFERENRGFFDRVRQGYLGLARADAERIRILDATGSVDDIKKRIKEELATL